MVRQFCVIFGIGAQDALSVGFDSFRERLLIDLHEYFGKYSEQIAIA